MGSENFFKAIIGSKKGKQTKGLSTAIKSKTSKKKGTHASSLVVCSEDWAATRIQTVFFLGFIFLGACSKVLTSRKWPSIELSRTVIFYDA
ncbi:unnamed protein product [Brassica rapa]|uniref:Uncharacterized protein n=1 Tax=Brassica campestris TaxID=3711 RepID=A0A8D9GDN7_BRACM|nr:unnamed protein product [Brassica rapa]